MDASEALKPICPPVLEYGPEALACAATQVDGLQEDAVIGWMLTIMPSCDQARACHYSRE